MQELRRVTHVVSDTKLIMDASFESFIGECDFHHIFVEHPLLRVGSRGALVNVPSQGGELVVKAAPSNLARLTLVPGSGEKPWSFVAGSDKRLWLVTPNDEGILRSFLSFNEDGDATIKRLRMEEPYPEAWPPNWHWLAWDADSKQVYPSRFSSSRRYKTDIRPLKDDFAALLRAAPKSFLWKGTDRESFGYIAEELDQLGLRRLVEYNEAGEPDAINYILLPIYVLEVVKQQQRQLDRLTSEHEEMKALLCADRPEARFCQRRAPSLE